jgi:hypothetical protein
MIQGIKFLLIFFLITATYMIYSYASELPEYQYVEDTKKIMSKNQLFTQVPTYQHSSFDSPATWFKAHEQLTYVMPDVDQPNGYYEAAFIYPSKDPTVIHHEVDCRSGETLVSGTTGNKGKIRRDGIGRPVRAANGKYFRYFGSRPQKLDDLEFSWFCRHNWTNKRASLTALVNAVDVGD